MTESKLTLKIGIVGGGPWGMAVLDRLISRARKDASQYFEVSLFDPRPFGPGVHDPDQAAHLLLNTIAAQVDSFSAQHFGEPSLPGAMTFLDWSRQTQDPETTANGFLSRSQFGRYMLYVYATLKANLPSNLLLTESRTAITGITRSGHGRSTLCDSQGAHHAVDHVFVCCGHGLRQQAPQHAGRDGALAPYPCDELNSKIPQDHIVGIRGMGLTAVDVVATLTEGRGGVFSQCHETKELVYQPSGREPVIYCFSRSGMPFSCRPSEPLVLSGQHEPLYCRVDALPADRPLDFAQDVLPLLVAEMWAAFALRYVALARGEAATAKMRLHLSQHGPESAPMVAQAEAGDACHGFNPRLLLLGSTSGAGSGTGEAARVLDHLTRDVAEAAQGETASPYKHAIEMLRVNRDFIRAAVAHGRLAPDSRALFFTRIAPAIAQLIVGPPLSRGREWLALARAGILRFELCRNPEVLRDSWYGHWTARVPGHVARFDTLVNARVGENWAHDSLLREFTSSGLCARIQLQGLSYLQVDEQARPIDVTGLSVEGISILGVPSEGATYFNHYLPSPRTRARVFEQVDTIIGSMLSKTPSQERRLHERRNAGHNTLRRGRHCAD